MSKKQPKSTPIEPQSKLPRSRNLISKAEKTPRVDLSAKEPIDTKKPAWKFSEIDYDIDIEPPTINGKKLRELSNRLTNFETMTWGEIKGPKQKNHYISVEDLAPVAQKRLYDIGLDNIERLLSLRISSRVRIFGILEGNPTFHILWWDAHHKICPSEKR